MQIQNYTLLEEKFIPELQATGYLFSHDQTKARVFYLSAPEDDNKVFSIGFKTLPENDYGIPHILEHSVLNGSRKYPVKEPFVELLKGSLNTFLNAMTFPDKTIYPVASRNEKDFMNLVDVYLDAVFYPNVKQNPFIFRQEGWHYELNGKDEPITYKGVVYNEMKGAFSSPDEVLMTEINRALYPDTVYSNVSGGDPASIPELTYEEFKAFHDTYYHPSNSYIFFYGNGDIQKHLTYLHKEYLQHYTFDQRSANIHVTRQQGFTAVREMTASYAVAEEEETLDKAYLAYSTVLEPVKDAKTFYGMRLLGTLLGAAEASPLKLALLKNGIGKDISVSIDDSIYQPTLNIVAKNVNPEQKDDFVRVIRETLTEVVTNGLDPKLVEATLNSTAFQLREANFGSAPKGLIYGIECLNTWLYDENPMVLLSYEEAFTAIREDRRFFENLIDSWILNNTHGVILTLVPEPGKNNQVEKETAEKLAVYKESLTDQQMEELITMNQELRKIQETPDSPEDLLKIPLLERQDLTLPEPFKEAKEAIVGGAKASVYEDNTHHILYTSLYFNLRHLTEEDLPYAGLLSDVMTMVDTDNYSYTELDNEIGTHLGGLSLERRVLQKLDGSYQGYLVLGAKSLVEEVPSLVSLAKEVLLTSEFTDTDRLLEIIAEARSGMEERMQWAGNAVAQGRAYSYFDAAYAMREKLTGIDYFRFLKDLEASFDTKKEEVVTRLRKVADILIRQGEVKVRFAVSPEDEGIVTKQLSELVQALPEGVSEQGSSQELTVTPVAKNEGFITPGQVQFVCKAGRFQGTYDGAMAVMGQILSLDYLWNKVRAQGGAYGCSKAIDRMGRVAISSFRDPNLTETIKVYEEAGSSMKAFDADEREMTKYIIGTMAGLDPVRSVSMKAQLAHDAKETGYTNAMITKLAQEVLEATPEKVRDAARILDEAMAEPFLCVVGSENKINENKDLFDEVSQLL